jgi:hypothetical protein
MRVLTALFMSVALLSVFQMLLVWSGLMLCLGCGKVVIPVVLTKLKWPAYFTFILENTQRIKASRSKRPIQNPRDVDNMWRHALHGANSPTSHSSTTTYTLVHQKV